MKIKEGPIYLEYQLPAPVGSVWSALVEVEEMKQWFFGNIPEFEAKVGFNTAFAVESGKRTFTHLWEILTVEVNKKITYNWSYQEYQGSAFLTFELIELEQNETKLRLTMEIREDFPDGIPEFARESCIGGWNYFIGDSLRSYLGAS